MYLRIHIPTSSGGLRIRASNFRGPTKQSKVEVEDGPLGDAVPLRWKWNVSMHICRIRRMRRVPPLRRPYIAFLLSPAPSSPFNPQTLLEMEKPSSRTLDLKGIHNTVFLCTCCIYLHVSTCIYIPNTYAHRCIRVRTGGKCCR